MEGYLNNPEANAGVMTLDGFATGDYGYVNDLNFLFLIGRRDDVFKVGGEKVSAKMIEESIFGFNEFKEFMVAPVDDQHMGTIPCVYYVLTEGAQFDRRRLLRHLKKVLPVTHVPSRFVELSTIRRTSSGKAIRSGLEQYC
jgi:O-succinylbenzoic acid--CoA ligase